MKSDADPAPFLHPGRLMDGDLELVLARTLPGDTARGIVPQYDFEMRIANMETPVGEIFFRFGLTEKLARFGGNIGYAVDESHRGQRLAARACRLLFSLARRHGMNELLITCSPDNAESRRTCEIIGAYHMDTIDAEETPGKLRPTCRYVVKLEASGN